MDKAEKLAESILDKMLTFCQETASQAMEAISADLKEDFEEAMNKVDIASEAMAAQSIMGEQYENFKTEIVEVLNEEEKTEEEEKS